MLKVFATQVVISRGYDNKPAISITKGNDSAASVRFRIGKKVYDPKAENNARWLNYSVKGFGPIVDRIEKMVQQFKVPETESELRQLQDKLYSITKEQTETGAFRGFRGLLEIMASETVIMTAIHNIKANKGAETAGTDGRTMRADILQQDYTQIVAKVQRSFQNYRPMSVRRKWIPKPGKSEKRPLGIPAIMDRIIQECVRIVLEPIMEAQFFKHSYGFRPWRDAHMALERVKDQVSRVGYYWIVEGDISKFFDNVNHTILIKKLWHMGVRDQRVLMIIKAMLKAGIMGEISENPLGTPQGGIISPLLANVYLHSMDEWITREWENKKTRTTYSSSRNQYQSLHRYSNLKPAYLVRYADDWILLTNSRENANRWKSRIANYLKVNLRLELSMEKTLVTNIKRKPIHFLGFTYKVTRGGTAMRGYKPVVKPQADRLNRKMEEVLKDISFLQRSMDKAESVDRINRINAKIRGLINYYSVANHVNLEMARYGLRVQQVALHALRRKGGTLVSANNVSNLLSLHENYKTMLAAIPIGEGQYIGVTSPAFCKYQKTYCKKPEETPYTVEGRAIHWERTRKKMTLPRMEEILTSSTLGMLIAYGKTKPIYNLEYFLNRMYALNRDKMRCRICGKPIVDGDDYHAHHIRKNLPLSEINRVSNLASTHRSCHKLVHGQKSKDGFSPKAVRQAEKYRKKLLS